MTAVITEAPRTPPRALVRVFWSIHRAVYRLRGGGAVYARDCFRAPDAKAATVVVLEPR